MLTKTERLYLAQMPPFEATNLPFWQLLMAHREPQWRADQLIDIKAKGWAAPSAWALNLMDWADLVDEMPLTEQAQWWLGMTVLPIVGQGNVLIGGGFWWAGARIIILASRQMESRIHECGHALGEALLTRFPRLQDEFLAALVRWATRDPYIDYFMPAAYKRVRQLVRGYVYGAPGIPQGFVKTRMWSEAYASLASGFQGQWETLPDYLVPFYQGYFKSEGGV